LFLGLRCCSGFLDRGRFLGGSRFLGSGFFGNRRCGFFLRVGQLGLGVFRSLRHGLLPETNSRF
jgi:hypothetical protein